MVWSGREAPFFFAGQREKAEDEDLTGRMAEPLQVATVDLLNANEQDKPPYRQFLFLTYCPTLL